LFKSDAAVLFLSGKRTQNELLFVILNPSIIKINQYYVNTKPASAKIQQSKNQTVTFCIIEKPLIQFGFFEQIRIKMPNFAEEKVSNSFS